MARKSGRKLRGGFGESDGMLVPFLLLVLAIGGLVAFLVMVPTGEAKKTASTTTASAPAATTTAPAATTTAPATTAATTAAASNTENFSIFNIFKK